MGKRIQKVSLNNLGSRVLELGYVGEHEHTRIEIDCTDVLWDYPDAACSVVVQPPNGDMYPLTPVREENSIIWLVTDSDVVYAGTGRVQITFTNNGEIVKSAIANTRIDQSIMATGPVPTPLENWMERAEETARQMGQDVADETMDDLAETKAECIAEIEQAGADTRATIPPDYTQLSDDVTELKSAFALFQENIPGTVQTIAFDSAGNIQSVTHRENNVVVRTDVFTFASSTITEVRTLASGESLIIVTNTETLETTTTYAAA